MKVRDIEWWIIGILGLTAFVLAMVGFDKLYFEAGIERSYIDVAFQSIKIFGMEFVDEYNSPLPLTLEIARWLAPAVILYTAGKAILYFIRREVNSLLIQYKRNHIIVNSLNEQARFLVADLLEKNEKVIVVASIANPKKLDLLEKKGAIIVDGDLHSDKFLRNIAAHKSQYFILMDDDDENNISDAISIYNYLVKKGKSVRQTIYTHVADDVKLTELKELNFFEEFTQKTMINLNCEIRIFSSYERISRVLFNNYSPDKFCPVYAPNDPQIHVAVVGSGKLAQSMIIRLARLGHYANLKKMKISFFFDNKITSTTLQRNFPQLCSLVDIDFYNEDLLLFNKDLFEKMHKQHPISAVYMLCENDSLSTSILNILAKVETPKNLDIILTLVNPDGILNRYYDAEKIDSINLHKFNIKKQAFTRDAVISESLDDMAKIIHADYLSNQKVLKKDKASHQKWELLPVELKNQNREQADHMDIKVRSINVDEDIAIEEISKLVGEIEIANTDKGSTIDKIILPEMELLAEMEHNRWCAHMALSGYVKGEKCNDRTKTHTDLIPYSQLSEYTKQWDRNAVKNIVKYMPRV